MLACAHTYELLNHIWSDDIRSFKIYLPVVCFLLGNTPASEFLSIVTYPFPE